MVTLLLQELGGWSRRQLATGPMCCVPVVGPDYLGGNSSGSYCVVSVVTLWWLVAPPQSSAKQNWLEVIVGPEEVATKGIKMRAV